MVTIMGLGFKVRAMELSAFGFAFAQGVHYSASDSALSYDHR
jgi:hypothetical protein